MNEYCFDWDKYLGDLAKSTSLIKCGHCGNKFDGKVVASYDNIRSYSYPPAPGKLVGGQDWEAGLIWELVLCPNCDGINLRLVDFHTGAEPEIGRRAAKVLYPSVIESPLGLPPEIDKAYQSALEIRHVDVNAFAVLLRKVIESVCQDRGASGKSLNDKLKDLAQKGDIPSHLAEMAHSVRKLGNVGAHFGADLTPTEASLLNNLCRAILEYVYAAPSLIEQVRLSLERIKEEGKI